MQRATSIGRLSKLLALGAPLLSAVSLAQAPTFSLQLLTTNAGETWNYANAIDDAGEALGGVTVNSFVCFLSCPVIWRGSATTFLPVVNGASASEAYGIDDAGQIAGANVLADNTNQAVIWKNGTATLLPSPNPQYPETVAYAINAAGQAVGYALDPLGDADAQMLQVEWNGLTPTVLGGVSGCSQTQSLELASELSLAINSNGLIVGTIICGNYTLPVVWHGTTAALLPVDAGSGGGWGRALAVNSSGLIVGIAGPLDKSGLAFGGDAAVWYNGVLTHLAKLPSSSNGSAAGAVNDRGIIVGQSGTTGYMQTHAILWGRIGAAPQDLNSLIDGTAAAEFTLTEATGINNSCAIVANGYNNATYEYAGFLLTLNDPSSCVAGM
jgi:uncharacterized membrane protein